MEYKWKYQIKHGPPAPLLSYQKNNWQNPAFTGETTGRLINLSEEVKVRDELSEVLTDKDEASEQKPLIKL